MRKTAKGRGPPLPRTFPPSSACDNAFRLPIHRDAVPAPIGRAYHRRAWICSERESSVHFDSQR